MKTYGMGSTLQMNGRFRRLACALLVIVCASGISDNLSAHHSAAAYDADSSISVTGTVQQLIWRNPHVQLHLAVQDDSGATSTWVVEAAATNNLTAGGWRRDLLEPGEVVSAEIRPMRSGRPGGLLRWVTLASGQVLAVDQDSPSGTLIADERSEPTAEPGQSMADIAARQRQEFEERRAQWVARSAVDAPAALPLVNEGSSMAALDPVNIANPLHKPAFDMTGVWLFRREPRHSENHNGNVWDFLPLPKLTPRAQAIYDETWARRRAGEVFGDPTAYCYPPGMPALMTRIGNLMFLQQNTAVYMVHRFNNEFRTIYTDGRGHIDPNIRNDGYNGDSVGYWDEDSLYVDTVGFGMPQHFVLAGIPFSDQGRVQERFFMLNDGNTLAIEFTLTDPVNWEGEWVDVKFYDRMFEFDIQEASCIADLDSTIPGLGE
jgi:hypothetical protein